MKNKKFKIDNNPNVIKNYIPVAEALKKGYVQKGQVLSHYQANKGIKKFTDTITQPSVHNVDRKNKKFVFNSKHYYKTKIVNGKSSNIDITNDKPQPYFFEKRYNLIKPIRLKNGKDTWQHSVMPDSMAKAHISKLNEMHKKWMSWRLDQGYVPYSGIGIYDVMAPGTIVKDKDMFQAKHTLKDASMSLENHEKKYPINNKIRESKQDKQFYHDYYKAKDELEGTLSTKKHLEKLIEGDTNFPGIKPIGKENYMIKLMNSRKWKS